MDAPSVKWYAHQVTLEEVKSDVLILLDCCSAGGTGGDASKGTKEVIAACGFETWAPGVGDHSFTKSLIEELKYMSTGPSFSVSSLHSRILDRLKHWNPIYDAEKLLVQGPDGRYQDQERRKTPVYISLNKERSFRSIEIVPRLGTRNKGREERSASTKAPVENTDENLATMTSFLKDDRYKHVEVTLSIQVETGQILRPNDMVNWIRDMPLLAKSIRLQAVVPSMSTLLILSLPVSTWNLLPSNPACSFIGFTTSMNLLLPNYYENISGWLEDVADDASSAQSATSTSFASSVSGGASSFTTTHTDIVPERIYNTDPSTSLSEGKERFQSYKATPVTEAPNKITQRPSSDSASTPLSSKPPEYETGDPYYRSIPSTKTKKFWVPGRVHFPLDFLRSNLP